MSVLVCSLQSLEQQCSLWLQLAGALEQAQAALLAGDVASFEQRTAEQNQYCHQLKSLVGAGLPAKASGPMVSGLNSAQTTSAVEDGGPLPQASGPHAA